MDRHATLFSLSLKHTWLIVLTGLLEVWWLVLSLDNAVFLIETHCVKWDSPEDCVCNKPPHPSHMNTHKIVFTPSKEIPWVQYGGWSALVYWVEVFESWGGEVSNGSCHSHLLDGTVNPRWHSCQSKQSWHILHKGVVTLWTSNQLLTLVQSWHMTVHLYLGHLSLNNTGALLKAFLR